MSYTNERSVWSSGTSQERSDHLNKTLFGGQKLNQPLFPKVSEETVEKDSDSEDSQEDTESESTASSSKKSGRTITVGELSARSRALMEKALLDRGYPPQLLEDDKFRSAFAKAIVEDGEIISKKTGKSWVERAIPEEPPAFVRPGKVKVGDKVQLLNWVPMGVHGAVIDLYPKGTVTKLYQVKCLITKEPLTCGCMAPQDVQFDEEERLIGVELDGRGPYPLKEGGNFIPTPFVTKDSTIIMRFPYMADPSGQTDHVEPGWM